MKYRNTQIDLREFPCDRNRTSDTRVISTHPIAGFQFADFRGPHGKMLFMAACNYGRAFALKPQEALDMIKGLIDERLGK